MSPLAPVMTTSTSESGGGHVRMHPSWRRHRWERQPNQDAQPPQEAPLAARRQHQRRRHTMSVPAECPGYCRRRSRRQQSARPAADAQIEVLATPERHDAAETVLAFAAAASIERPRWWPNGQAGHAWAPRPRLQQRAAYHHPPQKGHSHKSHKNPRRRSLQKCSADTAASRLGRPR